MSRRTVLFYVSSALTLVSGMVAADTHAAWLSLVLCGLSGMFSRMVFDMEGDR